MKRKQSRNDWLQKDSNLRKWIVKTLFADFTGVVDEHAILTFLNQISEKEFQKIKQRWNSHSHRAKRKSISCDITPASHLKLKKLQGKKSLTETLEEIIQINYDTRSHYKSIFERMTTELKQSKEKIIAREINRLSRTLETNSSDHQEVGKLKKITEEQDMQIRTLKSIVSIISEELINNGVTIKKDTLALIHKSLDTLLENAEQNQTASHD